MLISGNTSARRRGDQFGWITGISRVPHFSDMSKLAADGKIVSG